MTTEEKAKEYDGNFEVYAELVNRLEEVKDAILKHNYGIAIDVLYKPYPAFKVITHPELKESESEDERIRKYLKRIIGEWSYDDLFAKEFRKEDIIAWLEKRGEHKSADKVEPKFKVGDKIRIKTPSSFDKDMQVARIDKDYYVCDHIGKFSSEAVQFSEEDSYELIEQSTDNDIKEALRTEYEKGRADAIAQMQKEWSEEDEDYRVDINSAVNNYFCEGFAEELCDWLNSLKYRVQPRLKQGWKPSDEQMKLLREVQQALLGKDCHNRFVNFMYELKRLKEE